MALTRKLLKGMGITDEQVDTIIEAHTETVDGLKAEISKYKGDAEKLPGVQRELDDLKAVGDGGFKKKYEDEKAEFEKYKGEQAEKETRAAKETAYRELLKHVGIGEKYIDKVLRICDVDSVELEDGKVKNAETLAETIKKDFDAFVSTKSTTGADTPTPPDSGAGGEEDYSKYESMSMEDYIASRKPKT